MTTITATEAFKSKQNFSEFMAEQHPPIITSTLADYPKADGKTLVTFAELTQNYETLMNHIGSDLVRNLPKAPFIIWIVANERENVLNAVDTINKHAIDGFGIFVFKAILNGDKIDFECLLKPEVKIKEKKPRAITQTSGIQLDYWNAYFEVCDEMGLGDFQVQPASQHYQNIPIGVKGAYIKQTMSVKDSYVATEIFIGNDKAKYAELYKHKDEIEKELGTLIWQCLDTNKSCNIRQVIDSDLKDSETYEETARKHIELAELFKATFKKYL